MLAGGALLALSSQPAPAAPAIEEPEEPVPFEAVRAGPPASSVSRSAEPADNLPDLAAISSWRIPPIRWGGNTMSTYNWNSSEGSRTFYESQSVNLRAASHIYQPWFAQVSGNAGLVTGSSRTNGDAPGSSSRNTAITYGGNLNLFPQSRFPFQAYLQTSDSRASASSVSSQYSSLRMGATQSYRPPTGSDVYSANADRSIVTSGDVRSVVDAIQGSFSSNVENQSFGGNARYSSSSGDVAGQGSKLLSVNGTHSWRSDEGLTIGSNANFTNNQIRLLGPSGLSLNNTQIMQLGSNVNWQPDEDIPLTINGGGNLLHLSNTTETANTQVANLFGFTNAGYRFSDNLSGTAGVTLARTQSDGIDQLATGQNASLSYSGNPLTFGEYSYNWGLGAGVSNQTVSKGTGTRSVSGSAQHSVYRNIALSDTSALSLTANQSFSLTSSSIGGQSGVLNHGGGVSWRVGVNERTAGMLSASMSDTLSTGAFSSHFRSYSSQGNLQTQLSSRSVLTAGLNMSVSQQLSSQQSLDTATAFGTPSQQPNNNGSTAVSGSGLLSYSHRSPFDVANLVYTATLQFNANRTNLRIVSGDPDAPAWQTGTVFQNNADYRIGRLNFRATATYATLNGKKNASLFFMISRDIGDF